MPKTISSYRHLPEHGQAVVMLTDKVTKRRRDCRFGEHESPESRERYRRVIAEWEARGRRLPPPLQLSHEPYSITFNELAVGNWRFAELCYDLVTIGQTANHIARWGCVEPTCTAADLNDDDVVDGLDLLIMLSNWG